VFRALNTGIRIGRRPPCRPRRGTGFVAAAPVSVDGRGGAQLTSSCAAAQQLRVPDRARVAAAEESASDWIWLQARPGRGGRGTELGTTTRAQSQGREHAVAVVRCLLEAGIEAFSR